MPSRRSSLPTVRSATLTDQRDAISARRSAQRQRATLLRSRSGPSSAIARSYRQQTPNHRAILRTCRKLPQLPRRMVKTRDLDRPAHLLPTPRNPLRMLEAYLQRSGNPHEESRAFRRLASYHRLAGPVLKCDYPITLWPSTGGSSNNAGYSLSALGFLWIWEKPRSQHDSLRICASMHLIR